MRQAFLMQENGNGYKDDQAPAVKLSCTAI